MAFVVFFLVALYLKISNEDTLIETCKIYSFQDLNTINFREHDTVEVSASSLYEGDFIKRLLQGENYRNAWEAKIKAPILYLDTLYGGVTIIKEGGGKQTRSLRLRARDSTVYTLRSVNKNPEPLIPEFLKTLNLENIVVDGISSQHPYAAPVVAKLAESINVIHTDPKVVFLPKQERLNIYNTDYGNRLYMLEYETEGLKNWTSHANVIELLDTDGLQKLKMKLQNRLKIDRNELVRARLFDLVIGDWDRHAKQWGWAVSKKDSAYVAHPIPGDRDNAFFVIDGLIPTIISNENITKELRPFQNEIKVYIKVIN